MGMAQRTRLTSGRCAYMLQTTALPFFLLCGRSDALCERSTEKAHSVGRWGSCAPAGTSSREPWAKSACENCRCRLLPHVAKVLLLDPRLPLLCGVTGDIVAAVDVADLLILNFLVQVLL